MKILWHSAAPWVRSGYGQQTAVWVPRIASLGHDVVISAAHGLWGTTTEYQGIPVLPCGDDRYGNDILAERYRREDADLLITLMDAWAFRPDVIRLMNAAHWMPVDCTPLSHLDHAVLAKGKGTPIALSRHGQRTLLASGFESHYVPHGLDMSVWKAQPERETIREAMGVDDRFVIGMNCVNVDNLRKGVPEQLLAFSRLYRKHPDAIMLIHGQVYEASEPKGLNIGHVVRNMGLSHGVRFVDQYEHKVGMVGIDYLTAWYTALDLYTSTSYAEGFGLTILEALACEVPVVVTDTSSMPEVAGQGGWAVGGDPFWNPTHRAWWAHPSVDEIYDAYTQAYEVSAEYSLKKAAARTQALKYDADLVQNEYWAPVLKSLEG